MSETWTFQFESNVVYSFMFKRDLRITRFLQVTKLCTLPFFKALFRDIHITIRQKQLIEHEEIKLCFI